MHLTILLVSIRAPPAQAGEDLRGLEAAADQMPHESGLPACIERAHVHPAQAPFDGGIEQGGFIDVVEHLVDGERRDLRSDAKLLYALQNASSTVALQHRVRPGAGDCHTPIVKRPVS
jgi:hypothetical protein